MATTRRALVAGLLLWLAASRCAASVLQDEVRTLYENKQYTRVLEKALGFLNSQPEKLTPAEHAFLLHFTAQAYLRSNSPDMALSHWRQLEERFPDSEWLKGAWTQQLEMAGSDYAVREPLLHKLYQRFPLSDEAVNAGLELSRHLIRFGSFQKALLILDRLAQVWKRGDDFPESYILLAISFAAMRDNVQSIRYLNKGEAALPDLVRFNPEYLFWAARILSDNLDFARAARYLTRLQNVYPRHPRFAEAAVLLAQALEKEKKPFSGAIALVTALGRENEPGWKHTLLLGLGRLLLRLPPEDVARVAKQSPRYADAEQVLLTVQESSPSYEQRRESAILLSQHYQQQKQADKALSNYRQFLERRRDPLVEEFFRNSSDEILNRLYEQGQREDIIRFWASVSDRKSLVAPESLLRIAATLSRVGMQASAVEILDHLLKYRMYSRFWDDARRQALRIRFANRDYAGCLEMLAQVTPTGTAEADEFSYYHAVCWQSLKNDRELDEFLETHPCRDAGSEFQAKLCLLKAERLEARKLYAAALDIYAVLEKVQPPPLPRARLLTRMGNVRYLQGDMAGALSAYTEAERNAGDPEWLAFQKATILVRLGRKEAAAAEVARLRQVNADSFWLRQLPADVR